MIFGENVSIIPGVGSLAQLVEHRTFNPLVARSSRARPTNFLENIMNTSELIDKIREADRVLKEIRGYL